MPFTTSGLETRAGLFSKEKIRKKFKKRISGAAYDGNKQTIYTAPKSTNESWVQYSQRPHGAHDDDKCTELP